MAILVLMWTGCGASGKVETREVSTAVIPPAEQIYFRVRPVDETDVCGFKDMVDPGEPAADGMMDISAAHPYIRYFGRVDCANPQAPTFSFPGISIRAKFTGPSLDMRLRDHAQPRTETTKNYYNIIIDGKEPTMLCPRSSQEVYELARNLPAGEHVVEIFKRSESSHYDDMNVGRGDFLGLRIAAGEALLPLSPRPNRIEFIGDSITCGYGNELSVDVADNYHFTTANSNAWMAWGAIAARRLNAEYMAVAYSGRGLVRNYAGLPGETLPEMYLETLPDDPSATPWEPSRYAPGVVVVNLGTNDFSEGLSPGAETDSLRRRYRDAYHAFAERLRGYYPAATIVLALGPMMSDWFPEGVNAWTAVQEEVSAVMKARREAGDENIHMLVFDPQTPPYGEDYHPTIETHRQMADGLVSFLAQAGVF